MEQITKLFYNLLISMRPRQWLKNLAVFSAIFFGGRLFDDKDFSLVFITFLLFCCLSSAMYLLNDLLDAKADQIHFSKKNRPIAQGLLPKNLVIFTILSLTIVSLITSSVISDLVFLTCSTFILVQISYSLFLKKILILDIMAIAFSFMLRVFAGSFVIDESLSSWLILTVMMLSLFLAIGKRRSEITLLNYQQAIKHREILSHYPINLIDGLTFMMAVASLLTYSLFTFNTGRGTSNNLLTSYLPTTLANPRWLMITIPVVVYGIFRYLYLIFEKKEGESPEKILLTDFPLFTSVALWILLIFILIYVFNT